MIIYIIVAVFKVTWGLFCEALPVLRQKKGKEKETDFLNTVCILCLAHLQKCSVGGRLLMKNIFSIQGTGGWLVGLCLLTLSSFQHIIDDLLSCNFNMAHVTIVLRRGNSIVYAISKKFLRNVWQCLCVREVDSKNQRLNHCSIWSFYNSRMVTGYVLVCMQALYSKPHVTHTIGAAHVLWMGCWI